MLNRPDSGNALSGEILLRLLEFLEEIERQNEVRILILRGEGKNFCGGIDLREVLESEEKATEMFSQVVKLFVKLRQSPAVVICAAQGGAFGGGAGLIASGDLSIAATDLKLGCPEVLRGFDPVLLFPLFRRKLSDSALRQLLLTGQPIDASRAKEIGLVQYVVEKESLQTSAFKLAEQIRKADPNAVRQAKLMLSANERTMYGISLEDEFQQSLQVHLASWKTETAQERVRDFFRK